MAPDTDIARAAARGALLFVQVLRSARFVFALLVVLAAFTAFGSWAPWTRTDVSATAAPAWAVATGLDHPFRSVPFLVGLVLLFLSTLACTWDRPRRVRAALRGEGPASATLSGDSAEALAGFLREQGFSGGPVVWRRFVAGAFGGWLLHVGVLVVIAAAAAHQALSDGGQLELAEGETVRLAAPGVGFGRVRGPLAPEALPALELGLARFDPLLRQRGFAGDRSSRLSLRRPGEPALEREVDRAEGVTLDGVTVYQAIPTGLAVVMGLDHDRTFAVHLRETSSTTARAEMVAPDGEPVAFEVITERPLLDALGAGAVRVSVSARGATRALAPGEAFDFGAEPARLVGVNRWAGFTWSRSPALPGVFLGFAVVLLGALLLTLPFAVARVEGGAEPVARLHGRGTEALVERWDAARADLRTSGLVTTGSGPTHSADAATTLRGRSSAPLPEAPPRPPAALAPPRPQPSLDASSATGPPEDDLRRTLSRS